MRVGQSRRRDFNEAAIVSELESIGVIVVRISAPGAPDLLCYSRGHWLPVEVKRPRGHLTPAQLALRAMAPFPVVETPAEALALFGVRA